MAPKELPERSAEQELGMQRGQPKAWRELPNWSWNCPVSVLSFSYPTSQPSSAGTCPCDSFSCCHLCFTRAGAPGRNPAGTAPLTSLQQPDRATSATARAALPLLLGHITKGHRACAGVCPLWGDLTFFYYSDLVFLMAELKRRSRSRGEVWGYGAVGVNINDLNHPGILE